jgi:hypothetical protein
MEVDAFVIGVFPSPTQCVGDIFGALDEDILVDEYLVCGRGRAELKFDQWRLEKSKINR